MPKGNGYGGIAMGRPLLEIDESLVEKLAEIHCTMQEIGSIVGCSVDTLEGRFSEVIKRAKDRGRASLRRHQWHLAEKGNCTMLIWLGKQLLGQTDKYIEEIRTEGKPEQLIIIRKQKNDSENTDPTNPG